jgi:hypothetical protein
MRLPEAAQDKTKMKAYQSKLFGITRLVIVALLMGVTCLASAQVVEIPDHALRSVIRAALEKPTSDITVADMESLQALDASRFARGIESPPILDLTGLEAAINLTSLNLSGIQPRVGDAIPSIKFNDVSLLGQLIQLTNPILISVSMESKASSYRRA